eukprot:Skav222550  [mRNA]  locus=scaffold2837:162591:163006:- [translate_table: standard]
MLPTPHAFKDFMQEANADIEAWIAVDNYDLGFSSCYDEAALWLKSFANVAIWLPHLPCAALSEAFRRRVDTEHALDEGMWGSCFLLYVQHEDVDFILAFWGPEADTGRALP